MARKNPPKAPPKSLNVHFRSMAERFRKFVENYQVTNDGTKAAIAAGYAKSQARPMGCRLLKDPRVQELLSKKALRTAAANDLKAADVIARLMEIAYLDVGEVFEGIVGKNGRYQMRLKHILEMPLHVRRCVSSIKVVKKNLIVGDGETDDVYEVNFWNKNQALGLLATHLGLLALKVDVNVTVEQVKRMDDRTLALETQKDIELLLEQIELRKLQGHAVNV